MKKGTLFLKAVLCVMGAGVLAFCIFAVPSIGRGMAAEFPVTAPFQEAVMFGFYLVAVPFFFAIYQAFKLLIYIDRNTAFSEASVKALRYIKYSGLVMTVLLLIGMPVVFLIAESDDAPGAILFGLAFACSPIVVSVFAAVLQKLVQNAIDIKSENELTV